MHHVSRPFVTSPRHLLIAFVAFAMADRRGDQRRSGGICRGRAGEVDRHGLHVRR